MRSLAEVLPIVMAPLTQTMAMTRDRRPQAEASYAVVPLVRRLPDGAGALTFDTSDLVAEVADLLARRVPLAGGVHDLIVCRAADLVGRPVDRLFDQGAGASRGRPWREGLVFGVACLRAPMPRHDPEILGFVPTASRAWMAMAAFDARHALLAGVAGLARVLQGGRVGFTRPTWRQKAPDRPLVLRLAGEAGAAELGFGADTLSQAAQDRIATVAALATSAVPLQMRQLELGARA